MKTRGFVPSVGKGGEDIAGIKWEESQRFHATPMERAPAFSVFMPERVVA